MLNAIIIEDEKAAIDRLVKTLSEVSTEVKIKARLGSVKESIEYIRDHPNADIIFSKVELSDGLSFHIFSKASVHIPVIFIAGYEDHMMMAFKNNGIDYLTKPVNKSDLNKALLKYHNLKTHFSYNRPNTPIANLERFFDRRKKTRLLVKRGMANIALRFEDIALIYTENKLVYVIDRFSIKYISSKNLSEIETLDTTVFFRANRQYIININYIKSFKPYEKVKLLVDITIPEINHSIIISQETTKAFRKWMHDA